MIIVNHMKVKVKSISRVRLFSTPWTVAYQASLSMGFSGQECWSRLPFPSPGDLPDPGIEPGSSHCRQTLYCLSHQGSPGIVNHTISIVNHAAAAAAAKSLQSCPPLCDPIDGSPPGPAIPGILQARTLEWVAISFSNA